MGQFFILRSGVQQEYNSLLVNALNRIFKSNLSLNTFKWLLTKVELSCARILYPVLENASEMDTPSGAPNENIVQNHLNIALLNVL